MRAGRHILVVDEDGDIRSLMEDLLREEGYSCITVGSMAGALDRLALGGVALVLTDGFSRIPRDILDETTALVRAAAPAPVILCTVHPVDEETVHAAGFAASLNKPFDIGYLVTLVSKTLAATEP